MIWGDISRSVNGENVLGGVAYKNKYIYIRLITRVSVRYGEIFHEPKASEISRHISQLTSVISALFLEAHPLVHFPIDK